MKNVLVLLMLLSTSVFASDEWRDSDTYRETAFQVLNVIDWGQTRYASQHPDKFHEVDSAWLLSETPSVHAVDAFMLASGVIHVLVSYFLPHDWRDGYQYITIGQKFIATERNASIGVKISF